MTFFRHHLVHFPWKAFGLLVAVLYFGHWLGAIALRQVDECSNHFTHHQPWWTALLSTLVLSAFAFSLHAIHHRHPRPRKWSTRFALWLLSTLTVVAAYCAASWTEHALLGFHWFSSHPLLFVAFCLLGLVSVNRILRDILRSIEGPQDIRPADIEQTELPQPPPLTLLLCVSRPSHQKLTFSTDGSEPFATVTVSLQDNRTQDYPLAGQSLSNDIDALNGSRWNWQQLLRAIKPHTGLKKIILIGSSGNGSHAHLDDCVKLLDHYLPAGADVLKHPIPLAFENFNEIKTALRSVITVESKLVGEGRVAIDVTGGQATTSIAAAAATIGTEAVFQYVQTNPPCDVLFYDVHNVHAPNPHGHP